ncbi:Hypothetical predicted protein [Paramuricea clavata]|uniref:Uncharacterized protein n=1 Tax=Paramuricea clavata TaxID=317549 RepID=A0A7D9EJN1_PARCT|nr:Hypothetical predicted protein [Paramuricea clavata]
MEVLAKDLHKTIADDFNKVKIIEEIDRQRGGEAILEIEDLKEDLVINEKRAEKIVKYLEEKEEQETGDQTRIASLVGEIFKLDQRVTQLNEKVQRHENKLTETLNDHERTENELKEIKGALCTGQIAFDFEKDLATYIYPHGKKFGSRTVFTNMTAWLEKKKDTKEGREGNTKWNKLQKEFSWSKEHEKVFLRLLESRRKFAHPQVDRNTVQSQIPDSFTEQEKKCIMDINKMVDRVNELM